MGYGVDIPFIELDEDGAAAYCDGEHMGRVAYSPSAGINAAWHWWGVRLNDRPIGAVAEHTGGKFIINTNDLKFPSARDAVVHLLTRWKMRDPARLREGQPSALANASGANAEGA